MTTAQAYRYCQWVAARHRENFPVASWLMPPALRPHVAAVYAFARTADDVADEPGDPSRALISLQRWGASLERCAEGRGGDHPVFIAVGETIRAHDLPVQLFRDLLTAFTRDVTIHRYATWDDLLTHYCRYSANPVGRLVLRLFGYRDPALEVLSDHLCTALQMANFWQDLAVDWRKGRIYLPQAAMAEHGVTEQQFAAQVVDAPFRRLMAHAADVTQRLFDQGAPLPSQVSGRLRWELRATWLGGTTILRRVRAAGYDTFRARPRLTRWDLARIGAQALVGDRHAPAR